MFRNKSDHGRSMKRKKVKQKYQKPIKAIQLLIDKRKKAKLTTNGFAERASLDPKNYWRPEKGVARNPGRDTLITLARALVRYSKLFTEKDVDEVLAAADFPPAPEPECSHHCDHHTRYRW